MPRTEHFVNSSVTQRTLKITQGNLEQANRLLSEVHRDIGNNYFVVAAFSPGPNGVSKPVQYFYAQSPDEALPFVKKYAQNHHIYYSVAWQAEKKEPIIENGKRKLQRGGKKDCVGSSILWVELDFEHPIKTSGKENVKYPKDYEEIKNILSELPAPSIVISSGHGAHLIWLLIQPMTVAEHGLHTDNSLPAQWQKTIRYYYAQAGYTRPDPTHAIDRILRMPGTYNLKEIDNPVLCHIMEEESTWVRYDIEYLKRFIVPEAVAEAHKQVAATGQATTVTIGEIEQSIELNPYAEPPKDKFELLWQNEKFQMLWNMADPEKGEDLSAYDMALTLMALRRGWNYQEIANLLIAFRREHIGEFDEERINKPWSRSDYIPRTIANAEAELAKNNKVIALPNKGREAGQDGQAQVSGNLVLFPEASRQEKTLKDLLPDIPEDVANLKMPANWDIQNGMLIMQKKTKDGVFPVPVSQPIFISRFVDRKNGNLSKVELLYKYRGNWHTLIAERSDVFSHTKLVNLGNQRLPVSSMNAKQVVQFLYEFSTLNEMDIHYLQSINHLGWVERDFKTFISSPEDTHGYYFDVPSTLGDLADALHEKGTLEGWIEGIKPYVEADETGQPIFPIARAVIAAYFASPLLPIVGQRSFVIHTYSNTGGGKTASSYLGASVWGNPEDLKMLFNSTRYSLELRAGLFKNIPLFIDELQSVSKKNQGEVAEQILYLVSSNRGRERGSKNGDLRETQTWQLIVNTSGERPLTESNGQGGAKNRVLELYGKPIPDAKLASRAYRVANLNYGHAGKEFIKRIQEFGIENVTKLYTEFADNIANYAEGNTHQHVSMVTVIMLADFLISQWLFGKSESQAIAECFKLAQYILGNIETSATIDDAERARDYIESWIYMNRKHLDVSSYHDTYGWITGNEICLLPNVLEAALQEGGFDVIRILKDWKEKGWIVAESAKRLKIKRTAPAEYNAVSRNRLYVYALKKDVFMETDRD